VKEREGGVKGGGWERETPARLPAKLEEGDTHICDNEIVTFRRKGSRYAPGRPEKKPEKSAEGRVEVSRTRGPGGGEKINVRGRKEKKKDKRSR